MQNRIFLPLCALAAALFSVSATAATVLEVQSAGRKSTMTVESDKARLQSELVNYSLMFPSAGQYLYVAQDRKEVVKIYDMPADAIAKPIMPPPRSAKLVRKGAGPKIAGYPTIRYDLVADKTFCLSTYLSREAMESAQLKQFHIAFYRMQMQQKQMAKKNPNADVSSCSDAEQLLMASYPELGLAMRTVFPDGQVRQEILSIKTDVKVGDDFFQPPLALKQISHEQFLRAMERPKDNGAEMAKELTKPKTEATKTDIKSEAAPAVEKKEGSGS